MISYSVGNHSLLYQNWIGSLAEITSLDLSTVYENYTTVFSFYAQTVDEGFTTATFSPECSLQIDGAQTRTLRNEEGGSFGHLLFL